jgi:protease-4
MGEGMSRLRAATTLVAITAALLADPRAALANPDIGESRSILRDADRVYREVAGEGDGASTVVNPANLGFLRGVNGIFDVAFTARRARRRGSGAGGFVGIPLPFRIASLGFGYQFLWPVQPDAGDTSDPAPQQPDHPYSKVSFALAVPLMRWVRGLSVGLSYSRLGSAANFHAKGVNQLDVGIGYWPIRFIALGVVGRALNVPATGLLNDCEPDDAASGCVVQSLVVDPEVAVRPLGTPQLEFAGGIRIAPRVPPGARWDTFVAEPRGRVSTMVGGVKVFASAERFKFNPFVGGTVGSSDARDAVRLTAGVELDFGHVGFAAAPLLSANGGESFSADGGAARLRISQERYASAAVSPRLVTRLQLSGYQGERGMWRAIEEMDAVAQRAGVVVLETRGNRWGWAQTEEVREAILRLRGSGGKAVVYMEGAGLRTYFLAASADRIIANPDMNLEILGIRIQSLYYGDLLAKLGAKAEFVRIAEYKSSPEHYEHNTATAPSARQRELLVGDIWNHVLRTIAADRGRDALAIKSWIDEAPLKPRRAVELGIVDEIAYVDELDARLETWLARKVRIEKPSKQKHHADRFGPPPRVAVLFIEGDLVNGDSFTVPLLGRRVAGARTLTEQIAKLRADPSIKAVVVRINSPGGVVSAADAITRELELTRAEKPVVISMSDACASGGYYIATAGQYIYADATTMTGSIGIFYPKVDVSGTLAMIGVGIDEKNYGKHAGLRSWFKPYSEDEREAAQRDIADAYEVFTGRVAKARAMTPPQVDRVARGRVWSGVRGTEVGIVDAYGGLREAVQRARAIAGLRVDRGEVQLYPEPPNLLQNIRALFGFQLPNPLGLEGEARAGGVFGRPVAPSAGVLSILPAAMRKVLAHLPVALWLADAPEALAMSEVAYIVE